MGFDSRTRLSNKNIDRVCKILDRNDINISQHSLTSWDTLGQYGGPREGKQVVFRSAKGQWKMIKWWINEVRTMVFKERLSVNKHIQIILGAMLFQDNPSSNWWAALHLKDIFISSSWFIISNMAMTFERCYRIVAFEWMLGGCTHQDWLWDHLFWSSNAHFIAWIWVINWTSLMMPMHVFSRSDLTRWEESIEKNIKHTMMSLLRQTMGCMPRWLDSFQEGWW